jgi:hypothetical protein
VNFEPSFVNREQLQALNPATAGLDAGLWILDEIRNSLIFLICRKRPYNKLIIFLGNVNGRLFIKHPASSIASPQALNLTNAHKLVGLRHSFARKKIACGNLSGLSGFRKPYQPI